MVGIVLVSHSHAIAEGAAELARQMGGEDVRIETAGGLEGPDHSIGTDAMRVMAAIERAMSEDGVLVLMDLGSAVLSTEMALEFLDEPARAKVVLSDAPFVEGAVSAAVTAKLGAPLAKVAEEARGGLAGKAVHLGGDGGQAPDDAGAAPDGEGPARSTILTVDVPHGLHARPAARFVQTASGFDATVRVTNLETGRGPVSAASLNAVATLGVGGGHRIEVTATGPQAREALAALDALAARGWDEEEVPGGPVEVAPPAGVPTDDGVPADAPERGEVLAGLAAAPGIALGPARRFHVPPVDVPEDVTAGTPEEERARLDTAIERARGSIAAQHASVDERAGAYQAAIFEAHALFLSDEELLGPTREAVGAGRPAALAWRDSIDRMAATWEELDDPYLRARVADLRSVGRQVLAAIVGVELHRPTLEAPGVLVAEDLEPADTAGLDPATALGVATAAGGPTSHAAVLARSLGIPAVVGLGPRLGAIDEGTPLGLDGTRGIVVVDPDEATSGELLAERSRLEDARREAAARASIPAETADGVRVEVAANIGGPREVAAAVAAGAEGVGLFRTEFLFMGREEMPDEDEQEAAYRAAAEALDGRPMVVRTMDAGADKPLPYLAQPHEANPFLGVRGLRLGLARPDLLGVQLRALCRVSEDHRVRVMFPMVATLEELRSARRALEEARAAVGIGRAPEVGIMIEVPAAAMIAGHLAAEVGFFSVGTNDLTQYTLAADRGNDRVAPLADPLHPAVLRLIGRAAEAAAAHGAWTGVCGELAGDPSATAVLLGLGVRELSMSAPAIGLVKEAVRATETEHAREPATPATGVATADEVRALLLA
jgi:phosphocarrier protein FPr